MILDRPQTFKTKFEEKKLKMCGIDTGEVLRNVSGQVKRLR